MTDQEQADKYAYRLTLLGAAYRSLYILHFGLYGGSKLDAFKDWRGHQENLCEEDVPELPYESE